MRPLKSIISLALAGVLLLAGTPVQAEAGALYWADEGYYDPMLLGEHDKIVVIDPGHGGPWETGACSGGLVERDLNLKISKYIKQRLESYGCKVLLSRTYNTRVGLEDRARYAAKVGADALASAHLNGAGARAHGARVIIPNRSYDGRCRSVAVSMANALMKHLSKDLGLGARYPIYSRHTKSGLRYPNGSRADYFAVIRVSKRYHIPAVIMEPCYITNAGDRHKCLTSEAKLRKVGYSEADGLADGLGYNLHLKAPEPAELLDAEPTGKSSYISVTWERSKNAQKYIVFRRTKGGKWKEIGRSKKPSFSDKRATYNKTYYYTVVSENSNGRAVSYDKSGVKAKTPRHDIELGAQYADGKVALTWTDEDQPDSYTIYRSGDDGDYKKIATVDGDKRSYSDADVNEGSIYTYTIRSYKKCKTYTYKDRNRDGVKSYLTGRWTCRKRTVVKHKRNDEIRSTYKKSNITVACQPQAQTDTENQSETQTADTTQ